jgi:hypothetical protein
VPVCLRRTDWAGVCDDRLVPVCTAPKFSAARSIVIDGSVPCVTVKVCPPMVTVPLRAAAVVLCATASVTVPLPEPVLPAVTERKDELLTTDQGHPVPDTTDTETELAAPETVALAGEMA